MAEKQLSMREQGQLAGRRREVGDKLGWLNELRAGMTMEELDEVDKVLNTSLQVTARGAREEIERFAHLLLRAAGRHPIDEGKGYDMDNATVTRFLTMIRPSMRSILQVTGTLNWPLPACEDDSAGDG